MKKFYILIAVFIITSLPVCSQVYGKWPYPKRIRTYIPPNHSRTVMMKHGFEEWSRLTGNKIVFVYVKNPQEADLKVFFVEKIGSICKSERAIGCAVTANRNKNFLGHASIYIADKSDNGKNLSKDEVYTTMLHEIGHSIGLNHSIHPKSAMYPTCYTYQEIQQSDLKELSKIYGWK